MQGGRKLVNQLQKTIPTGSPGCTREDCAVHSLPGGVGSCHKNNAGWDWGAGAIWSLAPKIWGESPGRSSWAWQASPCCWRKPPPAGLWCWLEPQLLILRPSSLLSWHSLLAQGHQASFWAGGCPRAPSSACRSERSSSPQLSAARVMRQLMTVRWGPWSFHFPLTWILIFPPAMVELRPAS